MKKQYVVFWMPTIFHEELRIKKKEIINNEAGKNGFFDLSDNSANPYYAKFKLCNNGDIIIYSKVTTAVAEPVIFNTTLTLEPCGKRKNGFMQFWFDDDIIEDNCKEPFKLNLSNTIYHKIKEFYHEHECHTGKDSDLVPEISDEKINLEQDDNPALMKFLENFSDLFHKNAEIISEYNQKINNSFKLYDEIRHKIDKLSELNKQKFKEQHNAILQNINILNRLCENSSIEYTYCKTLLLSIYNKSFKHDIKLDPKAKDFDLKNKYRRRALNIRNSVRYIENIKYKNKNRQNLLSHIYNEDIKEITTKMDRTLNSNEKWQRISIMLAIFSPLFSLLLGFKSEIQDWHPGVFIILLIILSVLFIILLLFYDNIRKCYCLLLNKIKK
ncbi:MAG: hypothetical protein LBE11_05910 [Prevotellaceae bacterium]|jgi:hypothetical protein|nr:hypothetical protein [Prevotellaceae bacterium]